MVSTLHHCIGWPINDWVPDPDADKPEDSPPPPETSVRGVLRPCKVKTSVVDLTDSTDDEQSSGSRKFSPFPQASTSKKLPALVADLSFSEEKPVTTHPSEFKFEDF